MISNQLTYSNKQTSGNDLKTAGLEHQQFAVLLPASYLTFTGSQVRNLPIVKHYLPALSIVQPYQQHVRIHHQERYRYPKPIGLILIFPQHYYW